MFMIPDPSSLCKGAGPRTTLIGSSRPSALTRHDGPKQREFKKEQEKVTAENEKT